MLWEHLFNLNIRALKSICNYEFFLICAINLEEPQKAFNNNLSILYCNYND